MERTFKNPHFKQSKAMKIKIDSIYVDDKYDLDKNDKILIYFEINLFNN